MTINMHAQTYSGTRHSIAISTQMWRVEDFTFENAAHGVVSSLAEGPI